MRHICIIDCAIAHSSEVCAHRLSKELNQNITLHHPPHEGCNSLQNDLTADLYIIFGSASDVHERLPWQQELAQFAKGRLENQQAVFGICFGHQLMADTFGGKVIKAERTLKGSRKIRMAVNHWGFQKNAEYTLFVAHSYQVDPKNIGELKILATSEECPIDGLYHDQYPYLGFQGHPEGSQHFYEQDISPEVELKEEEVQLCLKDGLRLIQTIFQER